MDVETNGGETNAGSKCCVGKYGFCGRCNSDWVGARVVQLGWATSVGAGEIVVKERLVQPVGFRVSDKAGRFHGVSHELATSQGQPLRDVLQEFIQDMIRALDNGGRIVIHHLEFDAGIVAPELDRAGLGNFKKLGLGLLRRGYARWTRQSANG